MSLLDDARTLLDEARRVWVDTPWSSTLDELAARVDAPLRVAIAGKVKAGKSTLLNALVGERLAPTDEGECTRIVTWYRDGHTYEVRANASGGDSRQLRFVRDAGAIEVDLDGLDADAIDHLDVTWPSQRLREMTLIDTPGIGSLSQDASDRAWSFIHPDDDETPADAVLYLMKHLHVGDLEFLETFHDTEVSRPNPVNAIGVLSRADEIGVGRLDAMGSASRIATRYRQDPRVRRLVQTVVPVAGLLAESAATLTEDEYRAIAVVADRGPKDIESVLLSADRFVQTPDIALTDLEREHLLSRFGVFGVRLASTLIRRGAVTNARELSEILVERSGLDELRELLTTLFIDRRDLLKARSLLFAIDRLATDHPVAGSDDLRREIERVLSGAHDFAELRLLSALRAGQIEVKPDLLDEVERMIGSSGAAPRRRLSLDDDASTEVVRAAALDAIARWRRRAENPLTNHDMRNASQIVIRTCEGLVADAV
ncbi:MAG: dynamin family protein [Actinomycetota bacterium]